MPVSPSFGKVPHRGAPLRGRDDVPLLQHDICIGIFTRMLADGGDTCENLIHIRHVEIAAEGKILGTPVVSPEERMHVRDAGFSGSGITQDVPYIPLLQRAAHFLA